MPEALAGLGFPPLHRTKLGRTDGLERLDNEIDRRTRIATLFPTRLRC